ncbi:MAG: T9SS type A sorting domain-containing protein, partial [Saprospiraceae bacterium]|nr:T9SS type A sorting domain-containing protein [Saprospiraceae bacterium]
GDGDYVELNIYNLQGAVVHQSKFETGSVQQISLTSLPAGQYLVHISNGRIRKHAIVFKQ